MPTRIMNRQSRTVPPHPTMEVDSKSLKKAVIEFGLAMAVIMAVCIAAEYLGENHVSRLTAWVEDQGAWAPAVFIMFNALGVVFFIPQVPFTVMAGLLFGPFEGTGCALCGLTVGATLAFAISRYGARVHIERRFKNNKIFQTLNALSHTNPITVLALSRVIPVFPVPLLSYLWGLTRVGMGHFVAVTLLCCLPETLFLAAGGNLLLVGVTAKKLTWEAIVLMVLVGLILAGVITVAMRRFKTELLKSGVLSKQAQP